MTDADQAEVERANRRDLWQDVANRLTVAAEEIANAQGLLDDLREPEYGDQLQPFYEAMRRAANDATERAAAL